MRDRDAPTTKRDIGSLQFLGIKKNKNEEEIKRTNPTEATKLRCNHIIIKKKWFKYSLLLSLWKEQNENKEKNRPMETNCTKVGISIGAIKSGKVLPCRTCHEQVRHLSNSIWIWTANFNTANTYILQKEHLLNHNANTSQAAI